MTDCVLTDEGEIILSELPTLTADAERALKSLPIKRQRFVREYLIDLNAKQAYIRAGFAPAHADTNCHKVLHDQRVMLAIDCALELKVDRIAISADWIEQEYLSLYKEARHNKDRPTARQCLKDLGEHHAMFIKRLEVTDRTDIERRLMEGRKRLSEYRPALIDQKAETVN